MNARITPFREKVTLLGGGELSPQIVSDLLTLAPNLVACDRAAGRALDMGLTPDLVVGDMDSLDPGLRARLDPATVLEIPEQETTDFDKAIRSIDTPLILGAGFLGRRSDHELANFNTLVRYADRAIILVSEYDVCFHAPPDLRLALAPGMRVSLFPMAEVRVSASGLEYPLERLELAPWGRVGTSNRALDGAVGVSPEGPGLLVLLPRAALGAAIDALSNSAR